MENTSNTTSNNQNQQTELGALWKRKAKSDGQVYLACHLKVGEGDEAQQVKVVVFSNKGKVKDNQPDYRVYESKPYNPNAASTQGEGASADLVAAEGATQESEDLL